MIAASLGSAGTRAGVPDLALDSALVDGLELDCLGSFLSHKPPISY